MSHSNLCAQASRGRCRCSCNGMLHGHAALWTTSGLRCLQPTLVGEDVGSRRQPAESGSAAARPRTGSGLHSWVRAHQSLAYRLTRLATDGLWLSIDELPELDRRRLARSEHAVCALLAMVAGTAAIAASLAHVGRPGRPCRAGAPHPRPMPTIRSGSGLGSVQRTAAGHQAFAAFAEALGKVVAEGLAALDADDQRDLLVTVLCIAAVVACPDVAWHPEVQGLAATESANPMQLDRLRALHRLAEASPAARARRGH